VATPRTNPPKKNLLGGKIKKIMRLGRDCSGGFKDDPKQAPVKEEDSYIARSGPAGGGASEVEQIFREFQSASRRKAQRNEEGGLAAKRRTWAGTF